ncbi:membrane-associated protein, putative [Bodo saltans]|uniref:Membrane-associated protein, putative n=1 Tax=Bodo saltans TaxID=75058 RepID=A0A0S4J5K9_BODSA|nr:membrane-associated protein, putative [Bodo saltans]|eukprot:CUG31847.1 membrane-associated protein, putative [Bodo saltans]
MKFAVYQSACLVLIMVVPLLMRSASSITLPPYQLNGGTLTAASTTVTRNTVLVENTAITGTVISSPAQLMIDLRYMNPTSAVSITVRGAVLTLGAIFVIGYTDASTAASMPITILFENITTNTGCVGFVGYFPPGANIVVQDSYLNAATSTVTYTYRPSITQRCGVMWYNVYLVGATVLLQRNLVPMSDTAYTFTYAEGSFQLVDTAFVVRSISSRSYNNPDTSTAPMFYYKSPTNIQMKLNRSVMIFKDLSASSILRIASPLGIYDRSVMLVEDIKGTYMPLQNNLPISLDITSWWYFRRCNAITRMINTGGGQIENGQNMSFFDMATPNVGVGSGIASLFNGAPFGCMYSPITPTSASGAYGMSSAARYIPCGTCTISTQCYAPYTASIAFNAVLGRCQCSCTPQGYGPMCFPMPYPGMNEAASDILPLIIENVVIAPTSGIYSPNLLGRPVVVFRNVTFLGATVYVVLTEIWSAPIGGSTTQSTVTFQSCQFQTASSLLLFGHERQYVSAYSAINVTVEGCLFNNSAIALMGSFPRYTSVLVAHSKMLFPSGRTYSNFIVGPNGWTPSTTYQTTIVVLFTTWLAINTSVVFHNVSAAGSSGYLDSFFLQSTGTPLQIHYGSSLQVAYSRLSVRYGLNFPASQTVARVMYDSGLLFMNNYVVGDCIIFVGSGSFLVTAASVLAITGNTGDLHQLAYFGLPWDYPEATFSDRSLFLVANNTVQVEYKVISINGETFGDGDPETLRITNINSVLVVADNYFTLPSGCFLDTGTITLANGAQIYRRCNTNDPSVASSTTPYAPCSAKGVSETCASSRSVYTSYCFPAYTSGLASDGSCVCVAGYLSENRCFPVPLYPFYRAPAIIADPAEVINTTFVLENAVVSSASQYAEAVTYYIAGLGYRHVILRNITFVDLQVQFIMTTFAQQRGKSNSITVRDCTFMKATTILFSSFDNVRLLWYPSLSIVFTGCTFYGRLVFQYGSPPPYSNISLINTTAFRDVTSSDTHNIVLDRMNLYSSRLQVEHFNCSNTAGTWLNCFYLEEITATDYSLMLFHDLNAIGAVSGGDSSLINLLYLRSGTYLNNNTVMIVQYSSYVLARSLFSFPNSLFVQLSSAFIVENCVGTSRLGSSSSDYRSPMRFSNDINVVTQSLFLLKRMNTASNNGGLVDVGGRVAVRTSAIFSMVENEVTNDPLTSFDGTAVEATTRRISKCNVNNGAVTTTTFFTENPACGECMSDAECFMPLTVSTSNCICTCAAGAFGPRCLPVDTTLLSPFYPATPADIVVENAIVTSAIYQFGVRSVTWRNVTINGGAEIIFYVGRMFSNAAWAGQPLIITLENCTLPAGSAVYFWGSSQLTFSPIAPTPTYTNITIVGTVTPSSPSSAGTIVFVGTMPLLTTISISDSDHSYASSTQALMSMMVSTSVFVLLYQFRLTASSHLALIRINYRVPTDMISVLLPMTVDSRSSVLIDQLSLTNLTTAFWRHGSAAPLEINNASALIVRNSTLGAVAYTNPVFYFSTTARFTNSSVFILENNNFYGGTAPFQTVGLLSFLKNSLWGLYGNIMDYYATMLTGTTTLTVGGNASIAFRTNNFGFTAAAFSAFTLSSPYSMEMSCANTNTQGLVDTAAKAISAGLGVVNVTRVTTCDAPCTMNTSCFVTLTASFDSTTCACVCSPGGFGPRCLPANPPRTNTWTYDSWATTPTTQLLSMRTFTFTNVLFPTLPATVSFTYGRSFSFTNVLFGAQHIVFELTQLDNVPTSILFDGCALSNTRLYFRGSQRFIKQFMGAVNITIRNLTSVNGHIGFAYAFPSGSSIVIDAVTMSNTAAVALLAPFNVGSIQQCVGFMTFTSLSSSIVIKNSYLNMTQRPVLVSGTFTGTSLVIIDCVSQPGLVNAYTAATFSGGVVIVKRSQVYGTAGAGLFTGTFTYAGGAAHVVEDCLVFGSAYLGALTTSAGGAYFMSRSIVDFSSGYMANAATVVTAGSQYVIEDTSVALDRVFTSVPTGSFTNYVIQCSYRLGNTLMDSTMPNVGTPQLVACGAPSCTANVSCFLPNTVAFNSASCTCTCSAAGSGPRCLPVITAVADALHDEPAERPTYSITDQMITSEVSITALVRRVVFERVVFSGKGAAVRIGLMRMHRGTVHITFTDCVIQDGAQMFIFGESTAANALRSAIITVQNSMFINAAFGIARGFRNTRITVANCTFKVAVQLDFMQLNYPTNIVATNAPAIILSSLTLWNTSLVIMNCSMSTIGAAIVAPQQVVLQVGSQMSVRDSTIIAGASAILFGAALTIVGSSIVALESATLLSQDASVLITTTLTVTDRSQLICFDSTITSDTSSALYVTTTSVISGASMLLLDRLVSSGPLGTATPLLFLGTSATFTNASYIQLHHVHAAQDVLVRPAAPSVDGTSFFVAQCVAAGGVERPSAWEVTASVGATVVVSGLSCTQCATNPSKLVSGSVTTTTSIACYPPLSSSPFADSVTGGCSCVGDGIGDRCAPPSAYRSIPALPASMPISFLLTNTTITAPLVLGPRMYLINITNVVFASQLLVYLGAMRPLPTNTNISNADMNVIISGCTFDGSGAVAVFGTASMLDRALAVSVFIDLISASGPSSLTVGKTMAAQSYILITGATMTVTSDALVAWLASVDVVHGYTGPTSRCALHLYKFNLTHSAMQIASGSFFVVAASTADAVMWSADTVALINSSMVFRYITSSHTTGNYLMNMPLSAWLLDRNASFVINGSAIGGGIAWKSYDLTASTIQVVKTLVMLPAIPFLLATANSYLRNGATLVCDNAVFQGVSPAAFRTSGSNINLRQVGGGTLQLRNSKFGNKVLTSTLTTDSVTMVVACSTVLNVNSDAYATVAALSSAAGLYATTTSRVACNTCNANVHCDPSYTTSVALNSDNSCSCHCAVGSLQADINPAAVCSAAVAMNSTFALPAAPLTTFTGCIASVLPPGVLYTQPCITNKAFKSGQYVFGLGSCLRNVTFTGPSSVISIFTNLTLSPDPSAATVLFEDVTLLSGAVLMILGSDPLDSSSDFVGPTVIIRRLVVSNSIVIMALDFRGASITFDNASAVVGGAAVTLPTTYVATFTGTTFLYLFSTSFRDRASLVLTNCYVENTAATTSYGVYVAGLPTSLTSGSSIVLSDLSLNVSTTAVYFNTPLTVQASSAVHFGNVHVRVANGQGLRFTTLLIATQSAFVLWNTNMVITSSTATWCFMAASLTLQNSSWLHMASVGCTLTATTGTVFIATAVTIDDGSLWDVRDVQSIATTAPLTVTTAVASSSVLTLRCVYRNGVNVSAAPAQLASYSTVLPCTPATTDDLVHCFPVNTASFSGGVCACRNDVSVLTFAPYCLPTPLPTTTFLPAPKRDGMTRSPCTWTNVTLTRQQRVGLGCSTLSFVRVTFTGRDTQFVLNLREMNPGVVRVELINCTITTLAEVVFAGWAASYVFSHALTIVVSGLRAVSGGLGFISALPLGSSVTIINSAFTHPNSVRVHYAMPSGDYNSGGVNVALYSLALNASFLNFTNCSLTTLRSPSSVQFSSSLTVANGSVVSFRAVTITAPTNAVDMSSGTAALSGFSALVMRECVLRGRVSAVIIDVQGASTLNLVDVVSTPKTASAEALYVATRLTLDTMSSLKLIRLTHSVIKPLRVVRVVTTLQIPNGTVVVTESVSNSVSFWSVPSGYTFAAGVSTYVTGCNYFNAAARPATLPAQQLFLGGHSHLLFNNRAKYALHQLSAPCPPHAPSTTRRAHATVLQA